MIKNKLGFIKGMGMKHVITTFLWIFLLCGCSSGNKFADLQKSLDEFVEGKDANIGVAVIIDGKDTLAVNGDREFPMLSVYKFPIALALADDYRRKSQNFDCQMAIMPEDLHPDTYSPMTERIMASSKTATDTLRMPARDLLQYMLRQSDNNASDIVLKALGGAEAVDDYLDKLDIRGVNVRNSEDEMHVDNSLCYDNSSTPMAMACLIDKFDRELNDSLSSEIKQMLETCGTGTNRLAKPLAKTDAVIGHKTGTGFLLPDGRIMAVNDVGYVHLPGGHRYSIAVFIENSGYSMEQTEAMIAGISEIVSSLFMESLP